MKKIVNFSIVTITFNNLEGLKQIISSINNQNYENIEHIIIDGNSNDGTVEYLKNAELKGFLISEPDNGIYDAMNKGAEKAKGALYTWAAAMNGAGQTKLNPSGIQGVCPVGWHLPSYTECNELFSFLLKSDYKVNEIGLSNGPGIYRSGHNGNFMSFPIEMCWTTTDYFEGDGFLAWYCYLEYYKYYLEGIEDLNGYIDQKYFGHVVRCIKD